MHFNDNHFQILFDDWTPDNGHSPEVKYQIAGGDEITVTRDETVQFFQSAEDPVDITFSMKPARFEDGNYETFYRVRVTHGNAPSNQLNTALRVRSYFTAIQILILTVTPVKRVVTMKDSGLTYFGLNRPITTSRRRRRTRRRRRRPAKYL